MIGRLRKLQIQQFIRKEGPTQPPVQSRHSDNGRHPYRGCHGLPTLIWADLENPYVQLAIFAILTFGAIGFADDYTKSWSARIKASPAAPNFSCRS